MARKKPSRGILTDSETLGMVLGEARLRKGLTQKELAERLDLSQRYVSELENGKPGILMKRLFAVIRELEITVVYEIDRS